VRRIKDELAEMKGGQDDSRSSASSFGIFVIFGKLDDEVKRVARPEHQAQRPLQG
jgi:hypothetical protein